MIVFYKITLSDGTVEYYKDFDNLKNDLLEMLSDLVVSESIKVEILRFTDT